MTIADIDLPLYKYGFIHRYDLNYYSGSEKKRKFQKLKSFGLIIYFFINIIRYTINLLIIRDGKLPKYHLENIQYMGGIVKFNYGIIIIASVLTFNIAYLFNYKLDTEWLSIIKVLKGLETRNTIEIINEKDMNHFVIRIKKLKIALDLLSKIFIFPVFLLSLTILFLFFDLNEFLNYGLISALLQIIFVYSCFNILSYSFLYYFIACFYCETRLKLFNDKVERICDHLFYKYHNINELIAEHNKICKTIITHNKFWRNYYFLLNYGMIPINLVILQQIFFEDLLLPGLISLAITSIVFLISHTILNLITASVYRESLKSYNYFYKFYLKNHSSFDPKLKMKVKFFLLKITYL